MPASQDLLDDLAGLSGDSFHTAASQQAAEVSDADSRSNCGVDRVLPPQQGASSDVRTAATASPAALMADADADVCRLQASHVVHGQAAPAHLLHLPADVLDLVLLQLHPRDWCVGVVSTCCCEM